MSVSDARKRAVENYRKKNEEKTKHDTARRQAKRYIKTFATQKDVEELKYWLNLYENEKKDEIN